MVSMFINDTDAVICFFVRFTFSLEHRRIFAYMYIGHPLLGIKQ